MKKIISGILLIAILLLNFVGSMHIVFANEITQDSIIEDSDKLVVLKGLGFIPKVYQETNDLITRAESVSYIIDIIGLNFNRAENVFSDVPSEHKYYSEIYEAFNANYVSGVGDGKFAPDDPIKLEHLKRIVVDVLGYKTHASFQGYEMIANRLKLFKNVETDENGNMTYKGYVEVLYNMLHSEYAEIAMISVSNGESGITFESDSNKIFLNKFNIYRDYGILEGINTRSLDGNYARNGYVKINGNVIKCNKEFNNILLGSQIEYYYVDDEDNEAQVMFMMEYQNSVYTIDSEDIHTFSNQSIEFYKEDGSRTKKCSIDETAHVLINYAPMSPFNPAKIINMDATISLIDNDEDGKIDCILVMVSDTYFVSAIDADNQIVYDKRGKKPLDLSDCDNIKVIKNNENIDFSEIPSMSVINVFFASENVAEKSAIIEVSAGKFAGKITRISDEGEYYIYDKEYEVVSDYEQNIVNGYRYTPVLSLNLTAMFYLDCYGKIVAADTDGYDGYTYGLVIATSKDEGLSSGAKLKIYTQNAEMKVYECADKVKYNNGKRVEPVDFIDRFNNHYNTNDKVKLVKYSLNDDDKINEIYNCISADSEKTIVLNHEYLTETYWREAGVLSNKADTNSGDRTTQYGIKTSTVVFQVPSDFADEFNQSYEDKDFSVIGKSDMIRDDVNYEGTEIYDADEANGAGVMLVKSPVVENYTGQPNFMFVNDVRSVLRDDEVVTQLSVLWNGEITDIYGEENEILKDVKEGDIIQPILNFNNDIRNLKIVFRFADSQPTDSDSYKADLDSDGIKEANITQYSGKHNNILVGSEGSNNQYSNTCITVFGNLLSRNESGFTATYTDNPTDKIPFYTIPKTIIVCEQLRNRVAYRVGTWDEVIESTPGTADGSEVLLNTRNQKVTQFVLFK